MRVLVLGASGMLGHKLLQTLDGMCEAAGTLRGSNVALPAGNFRIFSGIDVENFSAVEQLLDTYRPEAVVNCVGVVKQLKHANAESLVRLNALLPHQLARACGRRGIRLVHISTDCVFSGRKGDYTEADIPDPVDMYGRSKLLGEVDTPGCVTLRTSFIGRELGRHSSLIDWFLSQKGGSVGGFTRAIYSGLTAQALSREVAKVLLGFPDLSGIWHVSADPISKFDLLCIVNDVYNLGIEIRRDAGFVCDRSMSSRNYRARTGFEPLSWPKMVEDMADDPTRYNVF